MTTAAAPPAAPWPVLVVDDDESTLQLTGLLLSPMRIDGHGLALAFARSAAEARAVLREQSFAVAVVDVVMETDHAGLDLVQELAQDPRHRLMALVLRTGQAGTLPEAKVIQDYRIADYWPKEELSPARIRARMAGLLRGHATARKLEAEAEERGRLIQEVHHRVYNNLQVVSSMLSLQAAGTESPETRQALVDGGMRVRTIALVHQQLYHGQRLSRVELCHYVRALGISVLQSLAPHARMDFSLGPVLTTIEVAVPVGLMLNELLTNAAKYAVRPANAPPADGRLGPGVDVAIGLALDDGHAVLTVTDAGPGLGPPGSAPRGTGVGWQLLEALAGQLRATVSTDSAPNGLRVEIRWPLPVLAA